MFRIGSRVNTPNGKGTIVSREDLKGLSFTRWEVRLDDPTRWACHHISKTHPFMRKDEMTAIAEDLQ